MLRPSTKSQTDKSILFKYYCHMLTDQLKDASCRLSSRSALVLNDRYILRLTVKGFDNHLDNQFHSVMMDRPTLGLTWVSEMKLALESPAVEGTQ